jgi:hypothetical protein
MMLSTCAVLAPVEAEQTVYLALSLALKVPSSRKVADAPQRSLLVRRKLPTNSGPTWVELQVGFSPMARWRVNTGFRSWLLFTLRPWMDMAIMMVAVLLATVILG